jgi:hypothetical protein
LVVLCLLLFLVLMSSSSLPTKGKPKGWRLRKKTQQEEDRPEN